MTAEEFEQQYAWNHGISVEQLRALGRIVRPCRCEDEGCEGWQSISRVTAEENDRDWPDWGGAEHDAGRVP